MYNDYFLRTDTEIEWYNIALENNLMKYDEEYNKYSSNPKYSIDIIGFIYDEEGNKKPGFLINIRTKENISEMNLPFIDKPLTPTRVWF